MKVTNHTYQDVAIILYEAQTLHNVPGKVNYYSIHILCTLLSWTAKIDSNTEPLHIDFYHEFITGYNCIVKYKHSNYAEWQLTRF